MTVGDFYLTGVLGQGATGTIYEARWGPRTVALKILHADHADAPRRRERFFAEAELFRSIAHPSMVKILSAGELPDGRPYLVMEKLAGETLAARLGRGPLTVAAAMLLLEQIGGAVGALHALGLVHREIEPGNVFLIDDGRHAVLLDMGDGREPGAGGVTTTATTARPPGSLAPERLLGSPATRASDIYELALLFYLAAVGQPPWADPTDPAARFEPRTAGQLLPAGGESVLMAALAARPGDRPATVDALVSALLGAPRPAQAWPGPRPSQRSPRRWWMWMLGLGLAAAGVVAGSIVLLAARGDPQREPAVCEAGDAAACRALAERYAFGDGVAESFERAAELFAAACDADDAESCHMLGRMNRYGEGVPTDAARAYTLYRKACELSGGRWGCREQANAMQEGRGTDVDVEGAPPLLRKACESGDFAGCTNLGLAYSSGIGVIEDHHVAVELWQKACDGDDATGCSNLGLFYRHGSAVPKDPTKAAELYARACELSSGSIGCAGLGELYAAGVGVPIDEARAAELFQRACDKKSAVGCHNAGVSYSSGRGVLQDRPQARILYRKGCDLGHPHACTNLGSMTARGDGGERDDDAAARLFQQACDGGNDLGCSNLAVLREAGRGVPKDPAEARRLRERACELGHQPSCDRLGGQ